MFRFYSFPAGALKTLFQISRVWWNHPRVSAALFNKRARDTMTQIWKDRLKKVTSQICGQKRRFRRHEILPVLWLCWNKCGLCCPPLAHAGTSGVSAIMPLTVSLCERTWSLLLSSVAVWHQTCLKRALPIYIHVAWPHTAKQTPRHSREYNFPPYESLAKELVPRAAAEHPSFLISRRFSQESRCNTTPAELETVSSSSCQHRRRARQPPPFSCAGRMFIRRHEDASAEARTC